jgi:UDP-N-acetylmuramoyl-tripeptide--D-alanyl-D-alanine ligase
MVLIAKLAMTATFLLNFTLQMLQYTHMLQLNSYRPERYKKWCRDNDEKLVNLPHLVPFLCIPAMWLEGRVDAPWLYGAAALIFALTALLNLPKKAKKPLVYTPRVWRLIITQSVLALLVLTLGWLLTAARGVGILGLFSVILWGVTGVAAYINKPLEDYFASRFVKDAARILKEHKNLIVIGITGSYGKTSVKTFLHALLSAKYNTLMTPGSYNTTMGVVRTVRELLRPSHQIFLAEMGAKQAGDIKEICDLTNPQYGIISSIGEQHLETFKTVDNIIATKFELADALPQTGKVFLNYDNPYIRDKKVSVPAVTYGAAPDSDAQYRATDIQVDVTGCSFTFVTPDGESRRYETKLLGAHNIQNLAGCMAVAHTLGLTLQEMAYPVRMLKPVEHRLQLLPNGFIDDAYNSNPAGFRGALDTLKLFDARRVLVTPGMVELGERQDALNKELGAYAADKCDIAVLVGERQAPPLKEGLLSAGFPEEKIYVAKTLADGLRYVNSLPPQKQIVLLENDLPDNF